MTTTARQSPNRENPLTSRYETYIQFLMQFKRNQVEEAISGMYGLARAPSVELKVRLKRLLESDRDLGRNRRSTDPEQANYAFFSAGSPGSGAEVWFSEYEAFALYTGWRLLEHGWPQGMAVSILRQARPQLEARHAEILKWDSAALFDEKKIFESAREGAPAAWTTRPVYLVIASRQGRPLQRKADNTREIKILENGELMMFLRSEVGLSVTNFELVRAAHALRKALLKTAPMRRGRVSG
jgi:hypothetical protein